MQNLESEPEKNNYPEYIEKIFSFKIPAHQTPERLDSFLARSIGNATRTKVQYAIESGCVTLNNKIPKPSRKIQPGDEIYCKLMKPPPIELIPENIPLNIVYEDDVLLVVNKPAGMCTHPGFGNRYGTMVNAVLYHLGFRDTIAIEPEDEDEDYDEGEIFASDSVRPGVVHRLDKDTSGLLLVSKNPVAHAKLAEQFANRTILREYNSIVWGRFQEDSGTYEGDIGRSLRDRKLFDIVKRGGKHAITDFVVLEQFDCFSLVKVKLRTGRTHQIRVHFSRNRHPVLGDISYGGDSLIFGGGGDANGQKIAKKCLSIAKRQMLHAKTLGFTHPETGEKLFFESDLPDDIKQILDILRID